MPVQKVIKNGKVVGYKWGEKGKVYKKKEDAEKQGRAIKASQNNFNQTDHVIDLFAQIERAYERRTQNAERRTQIVRRFLIPCQVTI